VTQAVSKRAIHRRRRAALVAALGLVAVSSVLVWNMRRGAGTDPQERASPQGSASPPAERPSPDNEGDGHARAVDLPKRAYLRRACDMPLRWIRAIDRGWVRGPARAGDIIIVPRPPNYMGTFVNTSHSGPYDFLQVVPLVFYGPGFIRDLGPWEPAREVTLADIAPTQAEVMGFDWHRRAGQPLTEILEEGSGSPRLVVTVSIDGGGWNLLRRWPRAWPNLASLIRAGTSVEPATVGSSPSITPAAHANMSTGDFPRKHRVSGIAIRGPGGVIQGAFTKSPNQSQPPVDPNLNQRLSTLAEDWDLATGNRAEVALLASGNYVLGLIGRGAQLRGGDEDIAGFLNWRGRWKTDGRFYRRPLHMNSLQGALRDGIDALDAADGRADRLWLGHDLDKTAVISTPAIAPYEARVAHSVMANEGFGRDDVTDLLYLHFKSPDHVGHKWNMISRESRDVLASVDHAVGSLKQWLDTEIGSGDYVMVVTADHGQTPLGAGGWPMSRSELLRDIGDRFDSVANGNGMLERTSATSLFSDLEEMEANGVTPGDVAAFLSGYTIRDNVTDGDPVPEGFRGRANERILAAAFPGGRLDEIKSCVSVRS
jgi:hypothetical protein